MRCIYDVASYRTHIHILLTTTTIIIITTVITFITIITSTLSITIIMFTCFIVFLIYNIIRTIIQRCLSVSLWREGHWTLSSSSKGVFVLPKHRDGKKTWILRKHLSKRPPCPSQVPSLRSPAPRGFIALHGSGPAMRIRKPQSWRKAWWRWIRLFGVVFLTGPGGKWDDRVWRSWWLGKGQKPARLIQAVMMNISRESLLRIVFLLPSSNFNLWTNSSGPWIA